LTSKVKEQPYRKHLQYYKDQTQIRAKIIYTIERDGKKYGVNLTARSHSFMSK